MSGAIKRASETPGRYLARLPAGSYIHVDKLPGTPSAAKSAASRAAARGDLVPLRRGLYYKGKNTRYGVLKPPAEDVALEVLGRKGVGPAGVSAARVLNLTTQVPTVPELVTAGPVPTGLPGVRVHKRNNAARRDLGYAEIAVLEVMRDWTFTTESTWDRLVAVVKEKVAAGAVRPKKLAAAARGESKPAVRSRLSSLLDALNLDAGTGASAER